LQKVGRGYKFASKKPQINVSVLDIVAWCFLIRERNFNSPVLWLRSDCLGGAGLYQIQGKPKFQVSES